MPDGPLLEHQWLSFDITLSIFVLRSFLPPPIAPCLNNGGGDGDDDNRHLFLRANSVAEEDLLTRYRSHDSTQHGRCSACWCEIALRSIFIHSTDMYEHDATAIQVPISEIRLGLSSELSYGDCEEVAGRGQRPVQHCRWERILHTNSST